MLKHFRDSITGLFVSKSDATRRPDQTQSVSAQPRISKAVRDDLERALAGADLDPSVHNAHATLRRAIVRALS